MKFVKLHPRRYAVPVQKRLPKPTKQAVITAPPLRSRSNKPLAMDTEDFLNILTYYHLQEFFSGRELIQALQEDDYAKYLVAPAGGIKRSTFFDTVNNCGVEQLLHVLTELQKHVPGTLPSQYPDLGDLVAIDGSLITGCRVSCSNAETKTKMHAKTPKTVKKAYAIF